jgi:hypothetical protein
VEQLGVLAGDLRGDGIGGRDELTFGEDAKPDDK